MKLEVGIDLGTTNTVVSYMEHGTINYLRFKKDESISSCFLYQNGKVTIGDKARRKSAIYPSNYIKSSKAYIGETDKTWIIEDKTFTPTDVASEVLKEVYKTLKKKKPDVDEVEVVITVPAYFKSTQIDETKKAAENAGLSVKQIITEPIAAAVAYGFESNTTQKLFIVDIGGGTFDTSILQVNGNNFTSLAIGGDSKLGGDDFDLHILNFILKHIRVNQGVNLVSHEKSGLSLDEYRKAYQALVNKSEEVKFELSEHEESAIEIANLFQGYNLVAKITREEFEKASDITIEKIKRTIKKTLEDANISVDEIDRIVLVGGSSRIPVVKKFVEELFGKRPYSDKPLDKLVAMGAAIVAHEENTVQIKDIISHSLGIEIFGNKFSPILRKNSIYPISYTQEYTTTVDYQKKININIYEGEDIDKVDNNSFYGGFILDNIFQATAGIPKIDVTFEFDKNRILKVTARDKNTNSIVSENIEIDKGSKKKIEPEEIPFDISLLIDVSGSMCGYPLDKAKEACENMVNGMIDLSVHRVALVEFESNAYVLSDLTNNIERLKHSIFQLHCKGGTNIARALHVTKESIYDSRMDTKNKELIILVTDGGSNVSMAINEATRIKNSNMRIVSIGVGHGVNELLLSSVASPGDYYQIDSIDKLSEIFKKIAGSLKTI